MLIALARSSSEQVDVAIPVNSGVPAVAPEINELVVDLIWLPEGRRSEQWPQPGSEGRGTEQTVRALAVTDRPTSTGVKSVSRSSSAAAEKQRHPGATSDEGGNAGRASSEAAPAAVPRLRARDPESAPGEDRPNPLAVIETAKPKPPVLRPDGSGRLRADEIPFVARVSRDGRMSFEDRSNLQARIEIPSGKEVGAALQRWYDDPFGQAAQRAEQSGESVPLVGGHFDATDALIRLQGGDPYFSRKLALLDGTRNQRAGMALTEQSENLREAVGRTRQTLYWIWRRRDLTTRERRRILFQLWDECSETGSPQVLEASRSVRASILSFIRRELPATSPDAYSVSELASLNDVRTSQALFRPYNRSEQ